MKSKSDEKVKSWIDSTFENVDIGSFPLLPGGHLVRDKNGDEILVFFDALSSQVKFFERPKKKSRLESGQS